MSQRIRGSYDDVLYKSTYTLFYYILYSTPCIIQFKLQTVYFIRNNDDNKTVL